jgi:hypothetical protein
MAKIPEIIKECDRPWRHVSKILHIFMTVPIAPFYLKGATTLIKGVAATGGLVNALVKAAEVVQKFF